MMVVTEAMSIRCDLEACGPTLVPAGLQGSDEILKVRMQGLKAVAGGGVLSGTNVLHHLIGLPGIWGPRTPD